MKTTTLRLTLAAVALVATAATASAQNLKAEIPFPFHAAGARMQAGTYSVRVSRAASGPVVQIYNVDEGRSVMTLPRAVDSPWSPVRSTVILSFACTNGNCELASMRDDNSTVYNFSTSKKSPETRIATVVLHQDRAE
jgi:hypothetical protein